MSRPRFVVRTVTGDMQPRYAGNTYRVNMSAHVCDTLYLFAVCATYRSDDHEAGHGWTGGYRGVPGALAEAHAHAARLNRDAA